MKCKLCGKYEAVVPDRNIQGRPKKSVCKSCHSKRLLGDLNLIIKNHDNLKERWENKND